MNDHDDFRPEDRAALEALRSHAAPADPAARERARRAFVDGEVTKRPRPRRSSMRRLLPALASSLALAASLVLFFGFQPSESWTLNNVEGPAKLSRDGGALVPAIGEAFDPGLVAAGDSTEVELAWGDLLLRLRPGSSAQLPPAPGRWFGRTRTLTMEHGEAFGSTGDAALGFELILKTPHATARLLGTTFAVIRSEDATCFCLYRGALEVTPTDGEPVQLPVEHRIFVYDDGRAPSIEPIDAGERMKLRMIDDSASER